MGLSDRTAPMAFEILKSIGYSAVGVGATETGHALDSYLDAARASGIIALHVDTKDRDGVIPYITKEVGGVRVGIVSFGFVLGENSSFQLQKRRYTAYKEARERSDILVLMNAGNVVDDDLLQRLTSRWGAPDVIIGGTYASGVYGNPKAIGKTYVLPSTPKAKRVGLLDIVIEPNKDPQLHYSDAVLDDSVAEDPAVRKVMDAYSGKVEDRRKASGMSSSHSVLSGVYYDSKSCVSCHKSEYDSWQTTKHAAALTTLVEKERDIPTCLECHSEHYRQTNAYVPTNDTSKHGVECASCHSKVLPHGADGVSKGLVGARIDLDTCRVCHTKDRSPEFESESKIYWERVGHRDAAKPK
jgi:hypothetical protein